MILFAEEKTLVADEGATSTGPEIVVFAAFNHPPKYPVRVSALAEMVCRSRTPTLWCIQTLDIQMWNTSYRL